MPLGIGVQGSTAQGLTFASSLRDASPDAWGRQGIDYKRSGLLASRDDVGGADEAVYMLGSDANRFGAIDFQASATTYIPRGESATLDQLVNAAEAVEAGLPLPAALERALGHGATMGGAHTKATVAGGDVECIARFSRETDQYDVVGTETTARYLAAAMGLDVARTLVVRAAGKKVVLVERFDRVPGGGRLFVASGMTVLGRHE